MAPKIDDKIYETTGKDCNRPGRRPYTNIHTNKQTARTTKQKQDPRGIHANADGKIVNKVEFAIIPFVAQMTVYGL
jgi:hypothetical protein